MMEIGKEENDSHVFEFVAVEVLDELHSNKDEIENDSEGVRYDEEGPNMHEKGFEGDQIDDVNIHSGYIEYNPEEYYDQFDSANDMSGDIEYDPEETGYGESESGMQEEPDYEFITNQMGGKKFYAFGFGFYKHRTRGERTSWVCEFSKQGCSAKAHTITLANGTQIVRKVGSDHNHLVDIDRKEKFKGRYKMKLDCLLNAETLPISISQNALKENRHLGEYFGTSHQLRKVIRYNRREKLNPYPFVDPKM